MKRKKETKLAFTKMSGAGNDFIIINALSNKELQKIKKVLKNKSKKRFVRAACNRFFGIGADGLLFLKKSKIANVAWEFYNSDGSIPEMCGNAARCVVRYCTDKNISKSKVSIQTKFGVVTGEKTKTEASKIFMKSAETIKLKKKVRIGTKKYVGDHIDSGVPHFVVSAKNIFEKKHLFEDAKKLRSHSSFGKRGTNVTFIEKMGQNKFNMISFERGVEDFTLACGTGALAAAKSFFNKNPNQNLVKIKMPGGEVTVQKSKQELILTGPAQYICKGEISSEVFNAKL